MTHRTYECVVSEQIRKDNGLEHLKDTPRSCLVYGLFPRPEAQDAFQRALDDLKVHDLFVCLKPRRLSTSSQMGAALNPLLRVSQTDVLLLGSDWPLKTAMRAKR